MAVYCYNPSHPGGTGKRIEVQEQPGKNASPYLKNKAKTAGGMAQVVEYLPSKCKALNSTPKTLKK
jgi:hypothetical protein